MVILQLTYKSLMRRKQKVLMALSAMSLACSFILLLVHFKAEFAQSVGRISSQSDLIIGAPSQPAHLALFGLFRIGNAPPAISERYLDQLATNPEIESVIPLSFQESHRGVMVTGTNDQIFSTIRSDGSEVFSIGEGFTTPDSIVLGAAVAEKFGYHFGEWMTIAAGQEPLISDEYPDAFKINGILAPTGSALDNSILVPLATLKKLRREHQPELNNDQNINLMFVKLHTKQASLPIQNLIRNHFDHKLEVIIPAQEFAVINQYADRLMNSVLGILSTTLLMALVMVFFSVSSSLAERRHELEILQMLGAKNYHVALIGLLEPLSIILLALLMGFVLYISMLGLIELLAPVNWRSWLSGRWVSVNELASISVLLLTGSLLTCFPAWRAYGEFGGLEKQ